MSRLIDADELKTAFPCGEYVRTESVRATIDHAPTVPQWIPCSERLPEEDSEYLCTYGALSGCSGWFVGIEYYDTKLQQFGFYTDDGHGQDVWHHVRNVVAWMELPTPWKEGQDGTD